MFCRVFAARSDTPWSECAGCVGILVALGVLLRFGRHDDACGCVAGADDDDYILCCNGVL